MDHNVYWKDLKDKGWTVGNWYEMESLLILMENAYLVQNNASVHLLCRELQL